MSPRTLPALLLILVSPVLSSAQNGIKCTADGLLFDHFRVEQGLSNPAILSIAEDRHGFLWIGTDAGLNRFDGRYFTAFSHNPRDPNTLAGDVCWALVPDSNGVWVNTHEGIDRYDCSAGNWRLYKRTEGYPGPLEYMFKDGKGQLWACGSFGLVCYRPALDRFDRYTLPETWPEKSLAAQMRWIGEYRDGSLWIGSDAGILIFDTRKRQFTGRLIDPSPGKYRVVSNGTFDADGGLWFTGWGAGLNYLHPVDGSLQTFYPHLEKTSGGIGTGILKPKTVEGTGFIWYLDKELGLFRFWPAQRRFEPVLTPGELGWAPFEYEFRTLFRDRQGILWIGTSNGLLRLDMAQQYIRYIDLSRVSGFPADWRGIAPIYRDTTDKSGCIWWVNLLNGKGLVRFDSRRGDIRLVPMSRAPGVQGLPNAHNFFRQKELWIGWKNGVFIFDDKRWKFRAPAAIGLSSHNFPKGLNTFLAGDKNEGLWVGEMGRLYWLPQGERVFRQIRLDSLLNRPDAAKPLSPFVSEMAEDLTGNCWFSLRYAAGCQPALLRFSPATGTCTWFYRTIANHTGFPANHDIFTLLSDKQGRLWFGTEQGAVWFNPESAVIRFHRFTTADGLPDNMVEFIQQIENGDLLFGTRAGIMMASPDLGKAVQLTSPYRVFDGATVPLWKSIGRDSFVCSYKKGFFLLDLSRWIWDSLASAVHLTGIRIEGQDWRPPKGGFPITETIRLSYRQTPVEFEFSIIQPHRSELNRLAWRMDGLGRQWHNLDNARKVMFSNLPGGSYTLWVKACNHHGYWSEPVAFRIIVIPPFWETNWFSGICIVALWALIWGVFRFREQQRRRVERVRQRIARDLHDEMGSTLSGISILSETAAHTLTGAAEQRLFQTMAGRTREVLDMMSDIVWSINPANDGFDKLTARMRLFAFEMCLARDIQLHFDAGQISRKWRMPPDRRKDFYLIFKEAFNNLVKYSVAKNAWVRIEKRGKYLTLHIADDGKGFDPLAVKPGNGLVNMRERALKWGGDFQITTSEGAGVQIDVQLPLG